MAIAMRACGVMELRCGRWQDVLADVTECDAVITDPPYSLRVEEGVRSGSSMRDQRNQIGMGYDPISKNECIDLAMWASQFKWLFVCGDHITWRWNNTGALLGGRYTFPPIPIFKTGAAPRMCADGPASWTEYCCASRLKSKSMVGSWPAMPGYYRMQTVRHGHGTHGVRGAKSIETMVDIIRDYSRPGDIIADPYAGSGTTLLAAAIEGRRCIGAEMDPKTFDIAVKRLSKGYTPRMQLPAMAKPKQGALL